MLGDRIEKLFPLLFLGERDADPLLDSLHGERCVCEDRLPVGLRVEQQEEDLLLVHVNGSLPGSREENRGTAGKEGVLLLTLDRFSRQSGQSRLQQEFAPDPGGEVLLEVVSPVPVVRPASLSLDWAGDLEGVRKTRVAEGHHRLGETGRYLPDLLHPPPGGKKHHPRRLQGKSGKGKQQTQRKDGEQKEGVPFHRFLPGSGSVVWSIIEDLRGEGDIEFRESVKPRWQGRWSCPKG